MAEEKVTQKATLFVSWDQQKVCRFPLKWSFKICPLMEKKIDNVFFFHAESESTILFLKYKKDYRKETEINAVYLSYRKPNGVTCEH